MKNNLFKFRSRKKDSHKGSYGHVLVLAGSPGLTGAAYLSSQAALLSGSGLVTLGIPKSLNHIMEIKLTEVMSAPLAETPQKTLSIKALSQIKAIASKADSLAIGPGLSINPHTQKAIRMLLPHIKLPMVIDADGINALDKFKDILKELWGTPIITPHPGELSRLIGISISTIQNNRIKVAKKVAKKYNIVVVLKGYRSVVANPTGSHYVNHTGNPGMASGGCGDVLTGIIATFLAQGIKPYAAAKCAVYIHGFAADLAKKKRGEISLIASDILEALPKAFQKHA